MLATHCKIFGPSLILENKYKNLGYWSHADDRAIWSLEIANQGEYRVELDYACHNNTAGNTFLIEVAGQKLSIRVEGTGTWDNYRRKEIGTIHLSAGANELLFHSAGPIKQYLIDLRAIRLVPVK